MIFFSKLASLLDFATFKFIVLWFTPRTRVVAILRTPLGCIRLDLFIYPSRRSGFEFINQSIEKRILSGTNVCIMRLITLILNFIAIRPHILKLDNIK